jgi:hypothetical protein
MSNEVSFCFSKTFVIHRCLRSESLFFDMRKMTYYSLQRQRINKHVLDLALAFIYGFKIQDSRFKIQFNKHVSTINYKHWLQKLQGKIL